MESEESAYLLELIEVGRRRGFVLSHEDGHGAFRVYPRSDMAPFAIDRHESWLADADIKREAPELQRQRSALDSVSKGPVRT